MTNDERVKIANNFVRYAVGELGADVESVIKIGMALKNSGEEKTCPFCGELSLIANVQTNVELLKVYSCIVEDCLFAGMHH